MVRGEGRVSRRDGGVVPSIEHREIGKECNECRIALDRGGGRMLRIRTLQTLFSPGSHAAIRSRRAYRQPRRQNGAFRRGSYSAVFPHHRTAGRSIFFRWRRMQTPKQLPRQKDRLHLRRGRLQNAFRAAAFRIGFTERGGRFFPTRMVPVRPSERYGTHYMRASGTLQTRSGTLRALREIDRPRETIPSKNLVTGGAKQLRQGRGVSQKCLCPANRGTEKDFGYGFSKGRGR